MRNLLLIVTVLSGVGALGLMMSATDRYANLGITLCPVAIISGLVFFYLVARHNRLAQSR